MCHIIINEVTPIVVTEGSYRKSSEWRKSAIFQFPGVLPETTQKKIYFENSSLSETKKDELRANGIEFHILCSSLHNYL